jgi:hypothetical protein
VSECHRSIRVDGAARDGLAGVAPGKHAVGRRSDVGLGWFAPARRRNAEPAFVEHLSGGAGFFDVMRIDPALGVGTVVVGNATKFDIDAGARLALRFSS